MTTYTLFLPGTQAWNKTALTMRKRNGVASSNTRINATYSSTASGASKFTIPNSRGENLAAVFNDTGSSEICIICHGLRASKDFPPLKAVDSALAKTGVSTCRFEFSGNGESEGEFSIGSYWRDAEDILAVVNHWRDRGRKIGCIFGHSKGGTSSLLYASKYGDVPTIINASGRLDLSKDLGPRLGNDYMERIQRDGFLKAKDWRGKEYKVDLEGLLDRLNTDVKNAVQGIPPNCRVLTIHGSNDEIVPVTEAQEFDKLIQNHTLKIVEGANHDFTRHMRILKDLVVEFLGK